MTVLVTGGAGFIGSNFVRIWLGDSIELLVNIDKLTYAGNPANLASVMDDECHRFVRGDIADRALVGSLLAEHRPRAVINFAAESHVDRSIHGPGDFAQYPTPARRPANSRLATSKLRRSFRVTLPDWTVGVNALLNQIVPEMRQ